MMDPSPRALIVGAYGQVGAALVRILGEGALPAGRMPSLDEALHIDLVKLAERPSLAITKLASLNLNSVYCVGGATDVERCESEVDWAMNTNCHGPVALAAAARHLPFVYFSTEYVFDGSMEHPGPYTESDPTRPLSMYGRSKLEAEQRILDIHPNPLIVRTTVVYGFDAQRKNFLYSLYRILKSDQTMRVPSDQVSTPTNNMDLAKATIKLIDLGVSGVVHVSGSELLSRYDFALEAAKILHLDGSLIQPVATHQLMQKAPRPLHAGLKTDKLQTLLGSNTMRPVGEAIQEWAYDLTRSESV